MTTLTSSVHAYRNRNIYSNGNTDAYRDCDCSSESYSYRNRYVYSDAHRDTDSNCHCHCHTDPNRYAYRDTSPRLRGFARLRGRVSPRDQGPSEAKPIAAVIDFVGNTGRCFQESRLELELRLSD